MKTFNCTRHYFKIIVCMLFISSALQANWKRQESDLHTQLTHPTPNTHSAELSAVSDADSLPSGVTRDWLNSLTDENGNRIMNEEEPETDALQQNVLNGNAAGENYGRSAANAGDVNGDGFDDVIIGAPNNNGGGLNGGKVYIYFGGTVIDNSPDVTGVDAAGNFAGFSVSSAGDVNGDGYDDVIIGAYGFSSFTGRAYIMYGGSPMNIVADVILTGEAAGHEFGKTVSGAGDLNGDGYDDVIVGAHAANAYTGKGYVFYGGAAMNNAADLVMSGEFSNDEFGCSVSGAGDVNADGFADALIGAIGSNSSIGKSYVYLGGASMDNVSDITITGEGFLNYFGASVSGAGDVNDDGYSDVIIGAYGYNGNTGRAYIFYGGAVMNSIADVTMTGEATNNSFGYSVSDAGDVNGDGFADVYVGAYGYGTSKGRAYLYYGGASMNNAVDIFMTGEESLNYFGYSVSGGGDINGDGFADMISGAYGYSSNSGRAYVYTNTMRGSDISDVTMIGENVGDGFGYVVSSAGDVNGDGYDDVIVGAKNFGSYIGRAYIYFGGITLNNVADIIMTGESVQNFFGESVSGAGDVNNDGYDDVIVGSKGFSSYVGRAYVFFGGAAMNNTADVLMTGENVNNQFGFAVSSAGDVNGDGYDDVIIGAPGYNNDPGRAYIYYGSSSMNNVADIIMSDGYANSNFGSAVSSAGDVNGDGYKDVIIGAYNYNNNTGRAYIYYGNVAMNNVADVTMTGENADDSFGAAVSSAGDVNGDGHDDIIVGAQNYNNYKGRSYIFFGSSVMNNVADLIMDGEPDDSFGNAVSDAGDINGDGYDDVIVGASAYNNLTGRAYVFFGGSAINNVADIFLTAEHSVGLFGNSVSSAGDVNNDGISDLVVGAPGVENNRGDTYIYLSSPPNNRKNLLLFGAIQGMYDPVLDTEVPDTIKVYLRNSVSPFARVDSSKNILLGPLTGQQFLFRNVQNGIPYYIEVTHRNTISTWSATPVTFISSDASIAFSVNSIYAYGNNEIQVDTSPYDVFAFYSGDVNQDGTIDATDVSMVDNDASNFVSGYVVTDLTGDDFVDGTDFAIADNNAANFVSAITP